MSVIPLKKPDMPGAPDATQESLQGLETVPRAEIMMLRGMFNEVRRALAVIEFDLDGIILDANDNFLAAMGYRLEEIRGRHHRIFVDPVYAASRAYKDFWASLAAGHMAADEFARIGKRGNTVWIEATYFLVHDDDGVPLKFMKFARDITLRKALATATESALRRILSEKFDETATKAMARIEQSSKEIAGIASVIDDVAQRTSMLGVNAEIAAAHAGEHGRAFAVVAREIRKLADQATGSVGRIRHLTADAAKIVEESRAEIQESAAAMQTKLAVLGEVQDQLNARKAGEVGTEDAMRAALDRLEASGALSGARPDGRQDRG